MSEDNKPQAKPFRALDYIKTDEELRQYVALHTEEAAATIAALRAEVERLGKDAERRLSGVRWHA